VARDAGVSKNTVRRGLEEMEGGDRCTPEMRERKEGAGRKKEEGQDETLITDLEGLLDPKGDPMSLVKWTTKSMAHLKQALQELGHQVGESTIRRVLQTLGYALPTRRSCRATPPPMKKSRIGEDAPTPEIARILCQ
jgi:transposase